MFDPTIKPKAIVSPLGNVRIPVSGDREDTKLPSVKKEEPKYSTVEIQYIPKKKNHLALWIVATIIMIIYSIIYHYSN